MRLSRLIPQKALNLGATLGLAGSMLIGGQSLAAEPAKSPEVKKAPTTEEVIKLLSAASKKEQLRQGEMQAVIDKESTKLAGIEKRIEANIIKAKLALSDTNTPAATKIQAQKFLDRAKQEGYQVGEKPQASVPEVKTPKLASK